MSAGGKVYDAAIVGGGPAGVSCAIWLARLGFEPILIEAADAVGGLCRTNPFPDQWNAAQPGLTGPQIADNLALSLRQAGVPVLLSSRACGVESDGRSFALRIEGKDEKICARHLVLATGVRARGLGSGLDDAASRVSAGGARESRSRENHSRAGSPPEGRSPAGRPPDGRPPEGILVGPGRHIVAQDFRGKKVAVLGGGDNAFENALYALEHGAASLRLFARSIRAQRQFVRKLAASHIHTGHYSVDPAKRAVDGQTYDLILVFYGWEPCVRFAAELGLQRSAQGFIATDMETAQTSVPGVYAIGEVAQRQHPCVVTALADGVTAAKAIQARIEAAA